MSPRLASIDSSTAAGRPPGAGASSAISAVGSYVPEPSVGSLYEEHFEFLVALAQKKYDLGPEEAEPLVHDVFLNLLASRRPVDQAQAYLVIGVCRACSEHWRRKRRETQHPTDYFESTGSEANEETLVNRITVQAGLRQLRERCRETLNLYFLLGCTSREVASKLGTTPRYAEKMISSCLKKLRESSRRIAEM